MAGQKESVFEGKTLDDAVRMGLNALGLSRAEVMITVMEEGSGGFLGLGARPYKVRVMPRPGGPPREAADRPERDRGDRRGDRGRRERGRDRGRVSAESGGRGDSRREARGGDRDRGRNGRGPRREGRPPREERGPAREERGPAREERGPAREERGAPRESMPPEPAPAMARDRDGEDGGRRRRRGRRGGRGRGGDRPMPAPDAAVAVAPPEVMGQDMTEESDTSIRGTTPVMQAQSRPPREPRPPRERYDREERGGRESRGPASDAPAIPAAELEALAVGATERLLKAMGFEARISAKADGPNVDVTAEVSQGEDLLTGRKGEVRQALQHVLNLTINRGEGMHYHLQLEINEFWRRREAELETLARSMADDAVARGDEVLTEYLNAQERRIIHVTLREDTRVKTYAIGDGLIKKLAVAPADHPEASRQEED